MNIVFFGDSITRGFPGASFFELLQKALPKYTLINEGRGGERVFTLYQRIKRMALKGQVDTTFLWVGVNDLIFNVLDWSSPASPDSIRKPWGELMQSFRGTYNSLLQCLTRFSRQVFTVPPLFIGEDLESFWQEKVDEVAEIIKEVTGLYENAHFLDLRSHFINELRKGEEKKEYKFTIDGVHLNDIGAQIVARVFLEIIKEFSPLDKK